MRLPSRLLAVTDRHLAARSLPDQAEALAAAGLGWLWLRDRDLDPAERAALARVIADRIAPYGTALTIGADVALAEAIGARGLHLSRASDVAPARARLGDAVVIGVSAHAPSEVRAAAAAGADYVTLSPIFASPSKPGYGPALGLSALGAAAASGIPVYGLGGIDTEGAAACVRAGATGVAVMGGLMREREPHRLVGQLLAAVGGAEMDGEAAPAASVSRERPEADDRPARPLPP